MPTQTYTTAAKITKRLSADGVSLRQDDDLDAIDQFIDDASDEIEFYCTVQYTPTVLATSGWVSKVCTDIAVFFYCWRRLNGVPEGIAETAKFAFERLEKIQSNAIKIPGLATSKDAAPVLSNFVPRVRPVHHPQVTPGNSTGKAEGYPQHTNRGDQYVDYQV